MGDIAEKPAEFPMPAYAVTYVVALLLIFFAMSGMPPTNYSATGSLQAMTSTANTFAGMAFQAVAWMVALALMWKSHRAILETCRRMKAITLLSLFAPLSALWSQNPSNSFRRGVFLLLGTLFVFYLVHTFSAWELGQIIVIGGIGAGLLGIAASLLFPGIGLDAVNGNAWQGVFRSKNGCAQVMLFFLTPALSLRFSSQLMRLLCWMLVVLALVLIVMANAKTSWILTAAYVLLMGAVFYLRRFRRRDATFLALTGFAVLALFIVAIPFLLSSLLPILGKNESLSGRLPLWGAAVVSLLKRPILGYGFASFWTGLQGESLNIYMSTQFEIYQAQNGLLELGLELGLVGVALAMLTLFKALRDALICFQFGHCEVVNWYFGLLALTISYNVDEAFLAREHFLPWLLYLVACTGLAAEARKVSTMRRARLSTTEAFSMEGTRVASVA